MAYYSNRDANNDVLLCKYQSAMDEIIELTKKKYNQDFIWKLSNILVKYELIKGGKDE